MEFCIYVNCESEKIVMDVHSDCLTLSPSTKGDVLKEIRIEVVNNRNNQPVDSGLNPHTSFESGYSWEQNIEIYEKCHDIVTNHRQPKEMLYLYGKPGCGKTTLLQCLGNLYEQHGKRNILYITAERFINEVINAIRSSNENVIREKYRKLDVLIFDDIQKLCGKASSTEEFTDALNDLLTAGAQVVISANEPLEELDLPEELVSKLSFATQMGMK